MPFNSKKSLGQHFLRSERALRAIIEAGEVKPGETILEIGPGTGVLTQKLLVDSKQVIAVEKDNSLYEFLKAKFQKEIKSGKLILIHEDILNFEIKNYLLSTASYKLISNIPYNITGAILEKFLSAQHQPKKMVLLVQKEVAKRITNEKSSILSISVRAYGEPKYIETVKAGSFAPAPKVDSAIIAIENISKKFFEAFPEKKFFETVRAGFQSKRKKLSSNLKIIWPKERVQEAFRKLNFDDNLRAEDVNIEMWRKLVLTLLLEPGNRG